MPQSAKLHDKLLAMNEALLLGSLRQHELSNAAEALAARLQSEIAERQLVEAALRESEARYRTLFELGPVAVYSCDTSGAIQDFNGRAAELWGRAPRVGESGEQFCGSFKLFRLDGTSMPHEQCPMAEVLSGKIAEVSDAEVLIERPDGSRVTVLVNIRPMKDRDGRTTGAINCFNDISERKNAERHQRLLMSELAHRGRNLLAVIQTIASRSLPGTRPLAEEREVLKQRIQALARSQSVLADGGYEGAALAEIIRLELDGFSDRVEMAGPDIMLNRRVAQTFGLVMHELATNATKHGALSQPGGEIAIHWSIAGTDADARFRFRWQESKGPPVMAPTRTGFGSLLLAGAAAQDFEAAPTISFLPEGLIYDLDAPLSAFIAPRAEEQGIGT